MAFGHVRHKLFKGFRMALNRRHPETLKQLKKNPLTEVSGFLGFVATT